VKSRVFHCSTASINSLLALLTSVGEIFRPINLVDIIERARVLTPVRNIKHISCRSISSYRLLRGITWDLNSPLRSPWHLNSDFSNSFQGIISTIETVSMIGVLSLNPFILFPAKEVGKFSFHHISQKLTNFSLYINSDHVKKLFRLLFNFLENLYSFRYADFQFH
jgi:hypothetical protein